MRLLRIVADQNAALDSTSIVKPDPSRLNESLRRAARLATHDQLVVVITDGDGENPETNHLMTTIARHNDVLVVFVFDPLEEELPSARLTFSDGARQLEAETGGLRDGFKRQLQDRRASARKFLLSREVPVLPLRTDSDVADQVLRAFGAGPGGRHARP
jgi:uncharacterized protein (DUF58 family)